MATGPVRRPLRMSGDVGAHLERIVDGLEAGARLQPERDLAAELGVSRTTVREALHELEQRRLVVRTPGRGTVRLPPSDSAQQLRKLSRDDAEDADVAELRAVVEPQIAALAARRSTHTDIARMERTLAAAHAGLTPDESLLLDQEFHLDLAKATQNPLLVSLCETTNSWVQEVRARSHRTRAGRRSSVEGHHALLDAVRSGNSELAAQMMVEHLGDVAERVGTSL